MASLISTTEQSTIVQTIDNIFDTWSRNVTIYKEPVKTPIAGQSPNGLFGFGPNQGNTVYSETFVSQIFPCLVKYKSEPWGTMQEADMNIVNTPVSIKVRKDCRDYINSGKTVKVVLDDNTFYINGNENLQTYLGTQYYIYTLRETL